MKFATVSVRGVIRVFLDVHKFSSEKLYHHRSSLPQTIPPIVSQAPIFVEHLTRITGKFINEVGGNAEWLKTSVLYQPVLRD